MHLLADYIINPHTRYEAHRLVYTPENEDPIEFGGFLAAAVFAALIVDTDEGDMREIALDTPEQREAFFLRYDKEVRRDDWGYLSAEVNQLRDNYVQIEVGTTTLNDLCPNARLLNLAMELTVAYMQRLVLAIFREHIWEVMPWKMPFPQWLIDAARVETRRQRYLKTDWTDASLNWHGYNPESVCYDRRFSFRDYSQFDEEKLSEDCVAWLDEIVEKCRKSGAKPVFFTAPCNVKRDIPRLKGMRSYTKARGIPYLDMNYRKDVDSDEKGGLVLQPRRDFKDPGHVNLSGSVKATSFLCKWIRSLHEFRRDYNNKYAERWRTDVARFSLYEKVADLLDNWRIDCFYSESKGKLKANTAKDEGIKIIYPRHLQNDGKSGCQISGAVAHAKFKLNCDSDGTVVLRLMAQYVTDENGKMLPIKQDFTSVRVNGKEQLPRGKTVVMNDESPRLKIKVAKGDTLEVNVSVSRHRYPKAEILSTLMRHPAFAGVAEDLNAVVNDRNFARFYIERCQ